MSSIDALELLVRGDVVRGREQHERLELLDDLAGERIDRRDALDLVAEELHADPALLVRGIDLDGVAAHPELVADERHVVALVLQLDEATEDLALVVFLADVEDQTLGSVHLGRAEPVDRTDTGDDDDVAPTHDRTGRGVTQPVDLVVDRRVLLDVGVGRGEVRLGLVVVVVGDEVLDPVLREELSELAASCAARLLFGARTSVGRPVSAITPAIVNDFPEPVMPSSVW